MWCPTLLISRVHCVAWYAHSSFAKIAFEVRGEYRARVERIWSGSMRRRKCEMRIIGRRRNGKRVGRIVLVGSLQPRSSICVDIVNVAQSNTSRCFDLSKWVRRRNSIVIHFFSLWLVLGTNACQQRWMKIYAQLVPIRTYCLAVLQRLKCGLIHDKFERFTLNSP